MREGNVPATCPNSEWIEIPVTNGSRVKEVFFLTGAAVDTQVKKAVQRRCEPASPTDWGQ